jgi:RND family efflux transporter MFP subunit
MMTILDRKRLLAIVFSLVFLACQAGYSQGGIRAITRPSADITLSFVQSGRIAEIVLAEGAKVQAGQVVARLDDAAEQVQLAQLKAQGEDRTQVLASEASLAQKKVDLEKLEVAASRDAATLLEVQHARLAVRIAELSLTLAKLEHEQAKRKYEEQKIRVDNMRLKSPVAGWIEEIYMEVGESTSALEEAVQVVQIDPLWIDVPVPAADAMGLKDGMEAKVEFPGAGGSSAAKGKVIFVGAVVDAASGTLRVRVEVPNAARRPAGEHVLVTF